MGSGFHFFPMENYFNQLIDKFLKFEEMWPPFCKFPILFSAVKLKLGPNFFLFIYKFKIGAFDPWTHAVLPIFSNSQKDWKLGFLNLTSAWIVSFLNSWEIENWDTGILAETALPNFSQFTKKQLGNWDFQSFLAFIFCQIVRSVFQEGHMCWVGKPIFIN